MSVQVDSIFSLEIKELTLENMNLKKELQALKALTPIAHFISWCQEDSNRFYYYFGLTIPVCKVIWNFLGSAKYQLDIWGTEEEERRETPPRYQKISPYEQFLMTLLKFRQDYTLTDLSMRFEISLAYVSRVFSVWTQFLFVKFRDLQDDMFVKKSRHQPLPKAFQNALLKDCRIVIDCTEVKCESSTNYKQQGNLFSSYKNSPTFKILLGCAPSGACMFTSDCFEGNISDKQIVIRSNLVEKLEKDDVIIADRGFTISDILREKGVKLVIPPFLGRREKFTDEEAAQTRLIARARIHIERYNERIKNFRILQGVIPLTLQPLISQIVFVLCCFVNFQEPLVE